MDPGVVVGALNCLSIYDLVLDVVLEPLLLRKYILCNLKINLSANSLVGITLNVDRQQDIGEAVSRPLRFQAQNKN